MSCLAFPKSERIRTANNPNNNNKPALPAVPPLLPALPVDHPRTVPAVYIRDYIPLEVRTVLDRKVLAEDSLLVARMVLAAGRSSLVGEDSRYSVVRFPSAGVARNRREGGSLAVAGFGCRGRRGLGRVARVLVQESL